ncbi:MAG: hypothetical protein ACD_51C00322G0003 [uncultured bacterium]|nr:MAG: hypothetical protein ACD_51C00322G0003 [uncultured bacterium]OGJ48297.1 MAG: hypothetical protein A2244_02160 [Candidatus Peregrinibacteria bacterium RIFOXYA2_FULL_41_18]OGJ52837.1 MAG: hypothetical protein A2448_04635 [Candidatus Peregrinibacteria bacterium RIFOXYC2_FULL_41_22]
MLHRHSTGSNPIELAQDADILTMGITPSGSGMLHLGHQVTLFNLLQALNATNSARGLLFVDDREFTLRGAPKLPSEEATANLIGCINRMVVEAGKHLGDSDFQKRIDVVRMSTFFKMAGINHGFMGHDFLEVLLRCAPYIGEAFMKLRLADRNSVVPICPDCLQGTQPSDPKKGRKEIKRNGTIIATCKNPSCETDEYEISVKDGDDHWTVFYVLVSLMNILVSRYGDKAVLEFFGGDYGTEWARQMTYNPRVQQVNGASKSERVSAVIEASGFAKGRINHVVGPLITTEGEKLSKARGDCANGRVDFGLLDRILESRSAIFDLSRANKSNLPSPANRPPDSSEVGIFEVSA